MDTVILIMYLAIAIVVRTKLALAGLVCFLLITAFFELTDYNALQIHAINLAIISPLLIFRGVLIKLATLSYAFLQWVMAIDVLIVLLKNNMDYGVFLTENSMTLLYLVYPYADFMLNLAIICAIIKTGANRHGDSLDRVHDVPDRKSFHSFIHANKNGQRTC